MSPESRRCRGRSCSRVHCAAQDFTNDERAELAVQSRAQAPVFGSPDRQAITDEVHAEMLKREPQVRCYNHSPDNQSHRPSGYCPGTSDKSAVS